MDNLNHDASEVRLSSRFPLPTTFHSLITLQHLGSYPCCTVQYDRLPAGHVSSKSSLLRSRCCAASRQSLGLLWLAHHNKWVENQSRQWTRQRMDRLHSLRDLSATACPSLSHLQALHTSHGSSLSVDQQLRGRAQSKVLPAVSPLCGHTLALLRRPDRRLMDVPVHGMLTECHWIPAANVSNHWDWFSIRAQLINLLPCRIHSVILLLESALFGLFVTAIMVDQLHAILYDETAVEAIQQKGTYRPNRRKYQLLADVFGRGHPALWLLPCASLNHSARYYDTPLLSHDV